MSSPKNATSTHNEKAESITPLLSASSSSTSSPSPLMCSTTVDELLIEKLVTSRVEKCPMCSIPAFLHPRSLFSSTSSSSVTTSSPSINREALKSLPKWKIDFKQSRAFLDRMEQVFFASNLPSSEFTKQLLISVTDVEEANYIKDNIIDKGLDWAEARIVFQNHFDVFNVVEQNEAEYEKIKKLSRETVQHYSDRYLNLCSVLGIPDNDTRAIKHFVHGLDDKLQQDYKKTVNLARIVSSNNNDLTSLRKVIALIISIELSNQSVPSYSSSTPSSSTPPSTPVRQSMCMYHPKPGTKHTTAECSSNPNNHSTSTTPTRNISPTTYVSPSPNYNYTQSRMSPSTPLPVRTPTTNINNTNYNTSNNTNVSSANRQMPFTPIASRLRSSHQVSSINSYSPLSSVSENDSFENDTQNPDYFDNNDPANQINNINNNIRLSDNVYEKCFSERLCFRCQQAGHISRYCPSKNSYNQRQ
jgi:hypothetical protein